MFIFLCILQLSNCDKKHKNKYSAEANLPNFTTEKYDADFRNIQKPFRIAKLNLVWAKAQHVSSYTMYKSNCNT